MSDIARHITDYLVLGGLFNPESMDHEKVRDLFIEAKNEIEALRAKLEKAKKSLIMFQGGRTFTFDDDVPPSC